MSREIYNAGRVAGLSAYEIYVRQALAQDPTGIPASESEWLAATLTSGASMILTVPATTVLGGPKMLEFELPENSKLSAGSTIFGSFFHGTVHMTTPPWADYVISYGDDAIQNTAEAHPTGTGSPPASNGVAWTATELAELTNYMKIIDGVAIQAGTWSPAAHQPPAMTLTPDFTQPGKIRIVINDTVDTPFRVLLTGLDYQTVVASFTSAGDSVDTPNPQDGDFLGPLVFPWASKIIFIPPSAYLRLLVTLTTSAIPNTGGAITNNIGTGGAIARCLSMASADGTPYPISNPPTTSDTPTDDTIYWAGLLSALINNHKIDILGELLRTLKESLSGNASSLALALTGALSVAGDINANGGNINANGGNINANGGNINTTKPALSTNKPFIVGANYIQFGATGPRLYVSSTAPTGARSGDFGIGW